MKPSYLLIGRLWDARPESSTPLQIEKAPYQDNGGSNPIRLSELLGLEHMDDVDALIHSHSTQGDLIMLVDYEPVASGEVPQAFFRLRFRQILARVELLLPNANVRLVRPELCENYMRFSPRTLGWIMQTVDDYTAHLVTRGILFNRNGFPILDRSCFLDKWPHTVVPYSHRKGQLVRYPEETLLYFYCPDQVIYPRLERVFDELGVYRSFMGAIAADVTVTSDMDPEWQAETMLLNYLFMAVLSVHGIKVAPNLRCGFPETVRYLDVIPAGVLCASSSLGCSNISSLGDFGFAAKVLSVRPSKLILYGKRDKGVELQLDSLGCDFRHYPDANTSCKRAARLALCRGQERLPLHDGSIHRLPARRKLQRPVARGAVPNAASVR